MINFEVVRFETKAISPKEDGSADFTVGIITGIVGNTYPQFIAGDTVLLNISNYGGKTGEQIYIEVSTASAAFVASKYPSIP